MTSNKKQDNLALWNSVSDTDPKVTREVPRGRGFKLTAIDGHSQLLEATSLWGPYGSGWGLQNLKFTVVTASDGSPLRYRLEADFEYPGGAFPVVTGHCFSGPNQTDDVEKSMLTDLRSKALSLLGFNADIFAGRFDDNRYVQAQRVKYKETAKPEAATATDTQLTGEELMHAICKRFSIDREVLDDAILQVFGKDALRERIRTWLEPKLRKKWKTDGYDDQALTDIIDTLHEEGDPETTEPGLYTVGRAIVLRRRVGLQPLPVRPQIWPPAEIARLTNHIEATLGRLQGATTLRANDPQLAKRRNS